MGHSKADVTALLDEYADAVPGDDDTKRVLDLVKVPAEDRADLVVLNTDEAWTVNPERFHSSLVTPRLVDGRSPAVRSPPSSARN